MFGDDPDPSVTSAWFVSGIVSDTHARGLTKGHGHKGGLMGSEKREKRAVRLI